MSRLKIAGVIAVLISLVPLGASSASPLTEAVVLGWDQHRSRTIVARGGPLPTIHAFAPGSRAPLWSAEGPEEPSAMILSPDGARAVVLDALNNEAFLVSLRDGSSKRLGTPDGPVAAVFYGSELFILCRDGRELLRIATDGTVRLLPVPADTTSLRAGNDHLYMYSRLEGTVTEVKPATLEVARSISLATAASDFEIDADFGYLTLPSSGSVVVFSLRQMRELERLDVGAIPTDLAVTSEGGLLDSGGLAVADPSSKKIWMSERTQSGAAAFGRGFLRGFIGLGLYVPRSSEYPTGVDRVVAARWGMAAYDSSTGSLYMVTKGKSSEVATGVGPEAFVMTQEGVAFWNEQAARVESVRPRPERPYERRK